MAVAPVFIISQPRAGSTLVQRVLGGYDGVATLSEPWLLVPLLSMLRRRGIKADYPHLLAHLAVQDFSKSLPGGMQQVREELRATAMRLYEAASPPGTRMFVDKTPAYHVIADVLPEVFPDGRFIYLWRNPLSVVASVLGTWGGRGFAPHRFRVDLFQAVENLMRGYEQSGDRAIGVRYEDLVGSDDAAWRRLVAHLGLPWDPRALEAFSEVTLTGRMGDPTGVDLYQQVSSAPLEKWRASFANPVRKWWARRYLAWIGEERLAVMGYELGTLLEELAAVPSRGGGMARDAALLAASTVTEPARSRHLQEAGGGSMWPMLLRGRSSYETVERQVERSERAFGVDRSP
jgi:hypothetical protein